jgi:hypothetical protein
MNFDDIESVWRSPHNQPSTTELEKQRMKLIAELRRRRRASRGLLWLTFIPLALFTAMIVLHVLWPDPTPPKVDMNREWAILPLFALPWAGWFILLRLHRRHEMRHPDYDRSIAASVSASLDENRTERTRYKIIAGLLAASIPLIVLIVHQLRAVGKAGDEILLPAYVIWPVYVALMVVWFSWYYFRRLLPRKRQLETLAQSYEGS